MENKFNLKAAAEKMRTNGKYDPTRVYEMEVSKLDTSKNVFVNYSESEYEKLKESIAKAGKVTNPIIVRHMPGTESEFIVASGNHRVQACRDLGIEKIHAIVREMTELEFLVAMNDANIQRTGVLPSEQAHMYAMMAEQLERDINEGKVEVKGDRATYIISQLTGSEEDKPSRADFYKKVRMDKLIPIAKVQLDKKELTVEAASELAKLDNVSQAMVIKAGADRGKLPNAMEVKEAVEMFTKSDRHITQEEVAAIIKEKPQKEQISIKLNIKKDLRPYLPEGIKDEDIRDYLLTALEEKFNRDHEKNYEELEGESRD